MENIWGALAVSALAGLSTGIGSIFSLFSKTDGKKFLSFCLGLSAGVMVYISLTELMGEAQKSFSAFWGEKNGGLFSALAFFFGMALMALIDRLVPENVNPHETKSMENHDKRLMRTGIMTAVAMAVHNFPEGFATFAAALHSFELALPTAFAVAVHNIPEGISVAVPIYHATKSRKKAFLYSFASGLAEPLGAILGFLLFMPLIKNPAFMGAVYAAVAGIMVYISVDELLPASRQYGHHHLSVYGFALGMAVMALSLWAFI